MARDAPVHHVGGRDDVGAGLGLEQRLADQERDGLVVEDALALHHAVMAVAGIGVEGDVGDDADLRHGLLDLAHGAADQVAAVQRLGAASGRARTDRYRERARWPGCRALRPARPRARPRRWSAARRRAWRRPAGGRSRPRPGRSARSGRRPSARSRAPAAATIRPCGCAAGGGTGSGSGQRLPLKRGGERRQLRHDPHPAPASMRRRLSRGLAHLNRSKKGFEVAVRPDPWKIDVNQPCADGAQVSSREPKARRGSMR